jgi:hypothetical protein
MRSAYTLHAGAQPVEYAVAFRASEHLHVSGRRVTFRTHERPRTLYSNLVRGLNQGEAILKYARLGTISVRRNLDNSEGRLQRITW